MGWWAIKTLRLPRWGIAIGVLCLVVAGAITVISVANNTVESTLESVTETAREAGASEAVAAGQETTLKQVGAANDASNQVRSGAISAKFNECVRSAAEGFARHCERYRPNEPVPDRRDVADPPGS